jgi:hypothetical protein
MIWLPPTSSGSPKSVSKLDRRHTGRLRKKDNLETLEGWGGAKSYDSEKAWPSINNSILCGLYLGFLFLSPETYSRIHRSLMVVNGSCQPKVGLKVLSSEMDPAEIRLIR